MKGNGWRDARVTSGGADGGIDIRARGAVAQVKRWQKKVGRPDVQRLLGVATAERAKAIFFSSGGYSADAARFADQNGIALFTVCPVTPCNEAAKALTRSAKRADRRAERAKAREQSADLPVGTRVRCIAWPNKGKVGVITSANLWGYSIRLDDGTDLLVVVPTAVQAVEGAPF
jgi:hypothetical protein